MDAYIYQSDLYCEECAEAIRERLDTEGDTPEDPDDETAYDSDDYPKGPYPDGGGEADTPQHCAKCRAFLENPLTSDGVRETFDMIDAWRSNGGIPPHAAEWAEFYSSDMEDEFRRRVDALWAVYQPKFNSLLESWSDYFREEGWEADSVGDSSDEEYESILFVSLDGVDCDIRLTLVESLCREGSGELQGVAFSLLLGAPCGHVIGGMTPGNYSEDLYIPVSNEAALAERWSYFDNAEEYEAETILRKHIHECAEARATKGA